MNIRCGFGVSKSVNSFDWLSFTSTKLVHFIWSCSPSGILCLLFCMASAAGEAPKDTLIISVMLLDLRQSRARGEARGDEASSEL